MSCDAESLMQAASCFRCIPEGSRGDVQLYLLCQWAASESGPQPEPPSTLLNGLLAYYPIDANDAFNSSMRSLGENRISTKVDPAGGFNPPTPTVGGAGYPIQQVSGTVYPALATGEMSGTALGWSAVNVTAGNQNLTWPAWPTAEGPVLYLNKHQTSGIWYFKVVPQATVQAGWVDNFTGWTDITTTNFTNYPETLNRLYYVSSQAVRPTPAVYVAGFKDPTSAIPLSTNPYLWNIPGFRYFTPDYTWAWVGRMLAGGYFQAYRSASVERWKGYCDLAGANPQVQANHTVLAGPNGITCTNPGGTGVNDWQLIVCRYSTVTLTMRVNMFNLTNGVSNSNSGAANPPRLFASLSMKEWIELVLAMGGSWHFNSHGQSTCDKFYCWNRSLTDLEVAELYNSGLLWEPEKPL